MNNKMIAVLSVPVFLAGVLIFYQLGSRGQGVSTASGTGSQATSSPTGEMKIDEQANVTVVVTPLDLSSQSAQWEFDIGMNTHSVELNQDMTKIAVLVDDTGKEYKPIAWDGPVGGHHRKGVLSFGQITPAPKSVELKIFGIADVVRTFTWPIK